MNKRELIVSAIEKMDISMLEVLLVDSATYQNATKEIFLNRLESIFKSFKKGGDTFLNAYPGICCSDFCPNKSSHGYTFMGNNTNNYTSFTFKEAENEIIDIRSCSSLIPHEENVEKKNNFYLEIFRDEAETFSPSPELAIHLQNLKMAYEEIIKPGEVFLTKEDYTYWLEKHEELFDSFQIPPIFHKPEVDFYRLYSYLKSFFEYPAFEQESLKASEDYLNLNTENENEILAWLVKYETLGDNLTLIWEDYSDKTTETAENLQLEIEGCYLNIDIDDFKSTFFFKYKFDEHYWPLLEKYTTLPIEEWDTLEEGTEAFENKISLTYHLKQRGILPTLLGVHNSEGLS